MGCCGSVETSESRTEDSVPKKTFSLCVLTWNVSGKSPNDSKLHSLFDFSNCEVEEPDIIVIGLQEIVDLNAKRLIKQNNHRMEKWENKIESLLNNDFATKTKHNYKYIKLMSNRLFGMLLMVFVSNHQTEFFNHKNSNGISNVLTSQIGTGLLNSGHNKGAVSITFKLFDLNFVFVNCHLAAHQDNIKGRTDDYNKIMNQLQFDPTRDSCKSISYSFNNNNNNNNNNGSKEALSREDSQSNTTNSINISKCSSMDDTGVNVSGNSGGYTIDMHIEINEKNDNNVNNNNNSNNSNNSNNNGVNGDTVHSTNNSNSSTVNILNSPKLSNMLRQSSVSSMLRNELNSVSSISNTAHASNTSHNPSVTNNSNSNPNATTILDNDIIFVFGDLNYRLNYDMTNKNDLDKVLQLIKIGFFDQLLANDQLINEMKLGHVFKDFSESTINFAPTFKYKCNNEKNEYNRKRIPSYCDRILWKTNYLNVTTDEMCLKRDNNTLKYFQIECVKYTSNMKQTMSDHKPVFAMFKCTCHC